MIHCILCNSYSHDISRHSVDEITNFTDYIGTRNLIRDIERKIDAYQTILESQEAKHWKHGVLAGMVSRVKALEESLHPLNLKLSCHAVNVNKLRKETYEQQKAWQEKETFYV